MPSGGWGGGSQCPPAAAAAGPASATGQISQAGLQSNTTGGQSGVCARVRLEIVQEAVVTRAAFLGTLEIDNGNLDTPLQDIQVTLDIRDTSGAAANDKFGVRAPELNGLNAVDGTGILASAASGSAKFTIISNREAAPEGPVGYRIGGTLRYREGNNVVEVPLLPDTITVYPDPVLNLVYFQQRDVFSDNPFTDVVEAAEPFTLGLMVKNTGKGDARSFRITSAQPRIIENEKGLLIDFKIIGTQVGNTMLAPTLTAELGGIRAGETKVAIWQMVSTLEGKFIDYQATFEQQNSLGDPRLSLIESVEIHELIHGVRTTQPGDDNVTDFLVNDLPDPDNLPDTLYLSSGGVFPVNLASRPATQPVQGNQIVRLTATMNSGWNYLRVPDGSGGLRLARVIRADGKVLPVGDNVWQTDRTFVTGLAGARRERMLHLLDFEGPGDYTLYFRTPDAAPAKITELQQPAPFVQTAAVDSLEVAFSDSIDTATFTAGDLRLVRSGQELPLGAGVTIQALSDTRYKLSGLGALTSEDGSYVFTVSGSGIADLGGVAAMGSRTVTWAKGSVAPVIAALGPITPELRTTPVTSVAVEFSVLIDPSSFTFADVTLRRDGGPNLANAALTVVPAGERQFTLAGLELLTGADGEYELTVNTTGVKSGEKSGAGERTIRWTTDTTGPSVAELETIRTNPRNIVWTRSKFVSQSRCGKRV